MLQEYDLNVTQQSNGPYADLQEDVSYTDLQEDMPEVTKSFTTRMHDSAVYAGGKVAYYVAAPALAYALYPVAQTVAEPIVVAAGSAIASLPVSWPAIGVMTFAAGMAIPRIVNYPVTAIQGNAQTVGESATTKLLSGSKTAITYAFNTSTNVVGALWRKPKPVPCTALDTDYEDLMTEPLVVDALKM